MNDLLRVSFANIITKERQADGSLLVRGKATDDSLDSDGQKCDMGWLDTAMPEWFKTAGNIREQHSSIAAGVAVELEKKDDGHYVTAKVVDEGSAKKVEADVLKDFSIGIRGAKIIKDATAPNGRIVGGRIVEISLVDRGSNFNSRFEKLTLVKADGEGNAEAVEELDENAMDAAIDAMVVDDVPAEVITPAEVPVVEVSVEVPVVEAPAEVIEEEKSATAIVQRARDFVKNNDIDLTKFDTASFDLARKGLAGLIASEAGELADGQDERYSLECLTRSLVALFDWKAGESWEISEVTLSDKPETVKSLDDVVVNDIIEKAVKSATEAVTKEIESYKSAVADKEKELDIVKAQLAEANGKAGVSKAVKSILNKEAIAKDELNKSANDLFVKAKKYEDSDPALSKSYKARAKEAQELAQQLNK